MPAMKGYERARSWPSTHCKLSPDLAEAHAQLAYVYQAFDWDWAAAEAEMQRALAIDPTNPKVLDVAGRLSATLGRWDDAERQLRAALVRDPLQHPYVIWNLGNTYYLAGRFAGIRSDCIESCSSIAAGLRVDSLVPRQDTAGAGQAGGGACDSCSRQPTDDSTADSLPIFLQAAGRQAEADEALKALIARWGDTPCVLMWPKTYAYRGDLRSCTRMARTSLRAKRFNPCEIVAAAL